MQKLKTYLTSKFCLFRNQSNSKLPTIFTSNFFGLKTFMILPFIKLFYAINFDEILLNIFNHCEHVGRNTMTFGREFGLLQKVIKIAFGKKILKPNKQLSYIRQSSVIPDDTKVILIVPEANRNEIFFQVTRSIFEATRNCLNNKTLKS